METETPRPQSRSDVNEPQTKEGEAQTSAAALKKRLTYRRCQEPDLSSERHAEHQALTMNCGYSDNLKIVIKASDSDIKKSQLKETSYCVSDSLLRNICEFIAFCFHFSFSEKCLCVYHNSHI